MVVRYLFGMVTVLLLSATTLAADPPVLNGLSFVSKEKLESGRGVGGPVMAAWKLTFKEKTVSWRYSDVVESFTYTIDAEGKVAATSKLRNNKILNGQYDAAKKELTWEGKVYTQE